MDIAIDARIINSSTGRYVAMLLEYLQYVDSANKYTILIREKDKDYWKPSVSNFKTVVAEFENYSFSEQFGFKKFLEDINPDLVHFCMPQQPVLYKGNHVTTVHDLTLLKTYNSDKNWLMYHMKQQVGRLLFNRIATTSNHIITPSQYTKDEYSKFADIPSDKVTVIYEASDALRGSQERYDQPYEKFLLYVGQQSDYKNIKRLGDAHQKLQLKHPNLGLILAGKKNAAAQKNEAYFQNNDYKNILFTDFVSDGQLAWLYSHCAAYVFPSLMEGFGLPGLEAMTYGAPVISSSATCLPEIYGDAAYYFDPLETDDIVKAISKVLTDEPLKNSLVQKGAAQVKKYSWRRMAEETHAVYMEALK